MATYSVFNWRTGAYDYYESPKTVEVASVPPRRSLAMGKTAIAPEDASETLPSDAVKVGEGEYAKGVIAVTPEEKKERPNLMIALGFAVAGYLLWKKL